MKNQIRRHIGQILLDGGFLSSNDLDLAFEAQKQTKELLGQVLVKMGVLKPLDINAPLLVQEHLSTIDDAVKIAAGERQLLGALLVQSGRISSAQLDQAIIEQKWTGEKLGDVFIKLGMLTERQLAALLDFQRNQGETATSNPLRLGELLIATGHISRSQLDDALQKQRISHKKIGEVLVEEGYISEGRVKSGFRLQKMLVNSVLAAILSLGMASTSIASSVNLQWDANTETDLAGYKVYYAPESSPLEGTTPLVVNNMTSTTISGLDPDISYKFAVTAFNTSGLESTFSNIVEVEEQSPPTVDITSPADLENVSGTVSLNVAANDNVAVSKVEYYVDGVLQGFDTVSPYAHSWDTSTVSGTHTLVAKAYDAAGNVSQSALKSVTVVNDLIAPTVALTSPAHNTLVSGVVAISSSASDNVGVTNVEFYCNGILLYATNVAPYGFNWDTRVLANGSYSINARAYDNAGYNTLSSTVAVTVNNPVPDVTAPTLNSFTLPATAADLTVSVTSLTASDTVGVTGYLITESAIAPDISATGWAAAAPATFTFSSSGARTVYAWVKDAAGNISSSRSASTTITLADITAPTISDALLALQISSGKIKANAQQTARLDLAPIVGGKSKPDGKVDTGDAIVILSKVVGKVTL
ncbi:MAG: Ig-like domain-containing protein [Desulfuromonadaceae bacterium]